MIVAPGKLRPRKRKEFSKFHLHHIHTNFLLIFISKDSLWKTKLTLMLFSERCFGEREKAIMKISEKTQKGVIEDDKRMTSLQKLITKIKALYISQVSSLVNTSKKKKILHGFHFLRCVFYCLEGFRLNLTNTFFISQ